MDKIEKMFLDLNSVLVKFWKEQGRPDKETKIALLERMLNWYKKMGYVTPQAISEEPDKSHEHEEVIGSITYIRKEALLEMLDEAITYLSDGSLAGYYESLAYQDIKEKIDSL